MIDILLFLGFIFLLVVWARTGAAAWAPKAFAMPTGPALPNETSILQHRYIHNKVDYDIKEVQTLHDITTYALTHHAKEVCAGSRTVDRLISEDKWITFEEYGKRVANFAGGLVDLGMKPKDKLAIFEETRLEWTIAAQASFRQSISVLTVYANLGEEALVYSLNLGKVQVIVANASNFAVLQRIAPQVPSIKTVIFIDEADAAKKTALEGANLKVTAFADVENLGKEHPTDEVPPSPEDVAVYMFTSGTTGLPKGVTLTHGNVMSVISSCAALLMKEVKVSYSDTYMSYLPLAHILAFAVHFAAFFLGVRAGFGNVRTLTDNACRNSLGDLKELKPTFFVAVPAIFEKIKKGVEHKISALPPFAQTIFRIAYALRKSATTTGHRLSFLDKIVFNKMKAEMGGRIRYLVCGSAYLAPEVCQFMQVCFAPVLQGYGLTETCGPACLQEPADIRIGSGGAPIPGVEIKLVDVPELGYLSSDKPLPRGEVYIRGPNVTTGYLENPEETPAIPSSLAPCLTTALLRAKAFSNGWFKTGDVGSLYRNGTISIIDRVKNLVKPPHGEYISLERLEASYRKTAAVEQMLLYVDTRHYDCVAVVVPSQQVLSAWATSNGLEGKSWEDLCKAPQATAFVLKSLQDTGRKSGLKSIETVKAVTLSPVEWTTENGMMTAANKMKRPEISKHFMGDINKMYAELEKSAAQD